MQPTRLFSGRRHRAPARRVLTVSMLLAAAEAFAWGSASAQTPTSTFDEVNARLRPGDRVTVTDAQQRTISGRVEEISTSSLRMMVDAKRQDFALHDLLRIERRTFRLVAQRRAHRRGDRWCVVSEVLLGKCLVPEQLSIHLGGIKLDRYRRRGWHRARCVDRTERDGLRAIAASTTSTRWQSRTKWDAVVDLAPD